MVFAFAGAACATAEIGLAIPAVKAKVSAAAKISFFIVEFLLCWCYFRPKAEIPKKKLKKVTITEFVK
jgi:hypothetical protein